MLLSAKMSARQIPVISTWKVATANGNFITWPGIDSPSIDSHLPKRVASAKGHMDQERNKLHSAQVKIEQTDSEKTKEDAFFPLADTLNIKTFSACAKIVPFMVKNTACHHLTGRTI
jgi:hypothetical protein